MWEKIIDKPEYVRCPVCGTVRNVKEAPECPVCSARLEEEKIKKEIQIESRKWRRLHPDEWREIQKQRRREARMRRYYQQQKAKKA